ncbi:MAG TPA: PH domain-containing protein [Micromonosporaceae bacterium]
MNLRDAAMPDEPQRQPEREAQPRRRVPPDSVRWHVDRRLTWAKLAGLGVLVAIGVLATPDAPGLALLGVAALALAGYAIRDLVAPVRLAADRAGVTVVAGYGGHHRLEWSEITRVRVDRHTRFLSRSEFLEIETDERLYLLSGYDLGVPVDQAAATLAAIRGAD